MHLIWFESRLATYIYKGLEEEGINVYVLQPPEESPVRAESEEPPEYIQPEDEPSAIE